MKIKSFIHLLLILIAFFLIFTSEVRANSTSTSVYSSHLKSDNKSGINILNKKILAYYPLLKKNSMNNFDYKIFSLTTTEIVFYAAKDPKLSTKEDEKCNKDYLYTQLNYQIQLPCNQKSSICTYGELKKTYSSSFGEIDWSLPEIILNTIGQERTEKLCLILTIGAFSSMKEVIFVCDLNPLVVIDLQAKISRQIRNVYTKQTSFFVDYLPNEDDRGKVSGLLTLDEEFVRFVSLEDKKQLLDISYSSIVLYPYTYYGKEAFPFNDNKGKHYTDRCFKFKVFNSDDTKVFCVFYLYGDFTKTNIIESYKARWLSTFYVNQFYRKMQPVLIQNSIEKMSAIKNSLEVESNLLIPIIFKFREEFLSKSAEMRKALKVTNKYNNVNLAKSLILVKEKLVKEICNSIELCTKALMFKMMKGTLPLGSAYTKYAFDVSNPYISLYPNRNIKVNELKEGLGKTLVQEASRLKGAENYFAEEVPLPIGGVPDYKAIINALDGFKGLRQDKKITQINDIKRCSNKNKELDNNLPRKLALLPLMSIPDFIFQFLGTIGNSVDNSIGK